METPIALPPAWVSEPGTMPSETPPVANLDERLAEPLAEESDLLGLSPSNIAGDDLDFAFDVSEQRSISEIDDPLDKSYSDLSDLSDSAFPRLPSDTPNPLAAEYDVSSSDLATAASILPPSHQPDAESAEPSDASESIISEPSDDSLFSVTEPKQEQEQEPEPLQETISEISSDRVVVAEPEYFDDSISDVAGSADVDDARSSIADLSPMMEQQIQETLEKVAWEAFSDLSESIVKQVMDRVEKIAWEVIPEMAETLVREEIRQMKGEDD